MYMCGNAGDVDDSSAMHSVKVIQLVCLFFVFGCCWFIPTHRYTSYYKCVNVRVCVCVCVCVCFDPNGGNDTYKVHWLFHCFFFNEKKDNFFTGIHLSTSLADLKCW